MAAGRTRKLIFNWHMERAQIKPFIEYTCLTNTSQCLCILPVFIPCRSVAV